MQSKEYHKAIMRYVILLAILIFQGCADAGYHPQYIISQDEPAESEEAR